jgi:LysM repeat protein
VNVRTVMAFAALLVWLVMGCTPVFAEDGEYIVKDGDVLWKIADAYGVTVQEIAESNRLASSDLIHPGQVIIVRQEEPNYLSEEELQKFSKAVAYARQEIDSLNSTLSDIGAKYPEVSTEGNQAYQYINKVLNTKKYFYDIVICDKDTNVLNVATKYDEPWIGLNLARTDRMNELFVDHPVFILKGLASSDGTPFIYASVPYKYEDEAGDNSGWVIAYIDPYTFFSELSTMFIGMDVNIGIVGTDGVTVYDSDMTEIGKNVLTDTVYSGFEELKQLLSEEMIPQERGEGSYHFYSSGMGSAIKKYIQWDSLSVFDKELRIYINTENAGRTDVDSKAVSLREFSQNELQAFGNGKGMLERMFSDWEEHVDDAKAVYEANGEDSEEFLDALRDISVESGIARDVYFVNTEKFISKAYPEYKGGKPWDTVCKYSSGALTLEERPFWIEPYYVASDYDSPVAKMTAMGYPIIIDGTLKGWIISTIRVYELAAQVSQLNSVGEDVNYTLVGSDGAVLYDGDMAEVGENINDSSIYKSIPEFQEFLTNEFMRNSSGEAEYEFYGGGMTRPTKKRIIWTTLSMLGSEFKFSMNSEWDR